jgi:hypothetical protein
MSHLFAWSSRSGVAPAVTALSSYWAPPDTRDTQHAGWLLHVPRVALGGVDAPTRSYHAPRGHSRSRFS